MLGIKKQQDAMINLSQASLDLIFALKPPGLSLVMINLLLSCG
jgi:hypothetical protein